MMTLENVTLGTIRYGAVSRKCFLREGYGPPAVLHGRPLRTKAFGRPPRLLSAVEQVVDSSAHEEASQRRREGRE